MVMFIPPRPRSINPPGSEYYRYKNIHREISFPEHDDGSIVMKPGYMRVGDIVMDNTGMRVGNIRMDSNGISIKEDSDNCNILNFNDGSTSYINGLKLHCSGSMSTSIVNGNITLKAGGKLTVNGHTYPSGTYKFKNLDDFERKYNPAKHTSGKAVESSVEKAMKKSEVISEDAASKITITELLKNIDRKLTRFFIKTFLRK